VTYLNIAEVESAISNLATAYPSLCTLIALPNATYEGNTSHALRISSAPAGAVDTVVILGGVHAREWGSCEILVNLATDLLKAYVAHAGLAYGAVSFSAATIAQIIDQRELVLYPLVNPDGRAYSQAQDQNNPDGWRKNRNPASSGGNPDNIGVDINRNYDFLWDFPVKFAPAAITGNGNLASNDPSSLVFHGTGAFSEPETVNVQWLVDQFARTRWFVDVHSYSQLFMYSWGDDVDQSTDSSQNFQNAAFDGQRGTGDASVYGEYIPANDLATASALASASVSTINAVRAVQYSANTGSWGYLAEQSYNLYGVSGASDDYMYSRSWVNPALTKAYSFTLEWGIEFHPAWSEMALIVKDISAGLIEFCSATFVTRAVTFELDRDHYGQDEIDALRAQPGGAVVKTGFWLAVDGFTPRQLGVTGPGSTSVGPPIAFTPSTGVSANCTSVDSTDPSFSPDEFQRVRFGYDVNFGGGDSAFTSFAAEQETVTLSATFQGIPAAAQVTFMKQPDPYIQQGAQTWWLSSDVRVLQVAEGDAPFGVTMGSDPEAFLLELTAALEAGTGGVQGVAGGESFDANTTEQNEILTVAPYALRGFELVPVYNFAIARVHYRGKNEPANDVRVFFRLFAANSTATVFEANTYGRDPAVYPVPAADWGEHTVPTPGVQAGEYVTIPCFGQPRQPADQPGGPNSLPPKQDDNDLNVKNFAATGGPLHDYFYGAFLDINQSAKVFPAGGVVPPGNADGPWPPGSGVALEPVSAAFIRNEHQCLIAEIAFDPVPIAAGTQPFNSDKLAQRNLSWSTVANPGVRLSRQALETFEVRPTPRTVGPGETPDELLIDWSGVPEGEPAQLFLPAVDADAVLAQAAQLYASSSLTRVDAHTIGCTTGGVTYIPLPGASGAGANFAGLMSVSLPDRIRRGEQYEVVVRQLTNASAVVDGRPPIAGAGPALEAVRSTLRWRRVLGTFQVNIPVSTKELMLETEELRFSIFQWIGASIPFTSRWYPVFQLYLHLLGIRVGELGGDPGNIKPSPDGYSGLPHGPGAGQPPPVWSERHGFTGKIAGIAYDHFGDFEGFVLELADGHERHFKSRERHVEAVVREAWKDRLLTTILVERHNPHAVRGVILRP
jgi:murein tripeptide amidase MpaA